MDSGVPLAASNAWASAVRAVCACACSAGVMPGVRVPWTISHAAANASSRSSVPNGAAVTSRSASFTTCLWSLRRRLACAARALASARRFRSAGSNDSVVAHCRTSKNSGPGG
jgi:hypothetical protein